MLDGPFDRLVKQIAGLPGLGNRSARRIVLHLLTQPGNMMQSLATSLQEVSESVQSCSICGNLDTSDPCRICRDPARSEDVICVVSNVADLWAIERTGAFKGTYHVLGGVLSALDGIGPDDLSIEPLLGRVKAGETSEVILALSATVDGQSTAHVLSDRILDVMPTVKITRLAHGVPVGGELDYLDEGTISTALKSRAAV